MAVVKVPAVMKNLRCWLAKGCFNEIILSINKREQYNVQKQSNSVYTQFR